jgi:hypothetical protein
VPIEPGVETALELLEAEPEPPGAEADPERVRQAAAEPAT